MPKAVRRDQPECLRPYTFLGVDFTQTNGNERTAECPFCGQPKFSLNVKKEMWQCWRCETHGNATTFVREFHNMCCEETSTHDYELFLKERGLHKVETLLLWGVCKSQLTNNWLVPGYNAEGKLCTLYQYMRFKDGAKLLPTPTLGSQMFGINLCDFTKSTIYMCEGPWDCMKLYEVLGSSTEDFESTSNVARSQLRDANVIGIPGVNNFKDQWAVVLKDKIVVIMFDNDHPRKVRNKTVEPAAHKALKRVAGIMSGSKTPPEEILYLAWGGTQDHDPELSSGYDVRDHLLGK